MCRIDLWCRRLSSFFPSISLDLCRLGDLPIADGDLDGHAAEPNLGRWTAKVRVSVYLRLVLSVLLLARRARKALPVCIALAIAGVRAVDPAVEYAEGLFVAAWRHAARKGGAAVFTDALLRIVRVFPSHGGYPGQRKATIRLMG